MPANEPARLRKVALLKTRDEATSAFIDSVTAAAATIAGMPMSAITIVGESLVEVRWSTGMSLENSPRVDSICSYTVASGAPFFVPDTRSDARFADNPYVVGPPYVRFYAGFPLTVSGQSMGSLCVIDDRPRTLSDEQVERLAVLAAGAAAWLALESSPAGRDVGG